MSKGRKKYIILSLLPIAAVIMAAFLFGRGRGEEFLVVNGEGVGEEEYLQYMKDCRFYVERYFAENFDADIDADDFWGKEFEGENPCSRLIEDTVAALIRQRAVYELAEERGYIEDSSYEGLLGRVEQENASRARKLANNEIVYGLTSFSLEQWIGYEEGILEETFVNDLTNEEMQITEEERQEFFESREWANVDGKPGVTLEELGSGIDTELRKERYAQLIESRAENAEVWRDEAALYEFTLVNLNN